MLSQGGFIVKTETADETCYKPQETQSNHCVGDFKPKIRARDQLLGGHEPDMKTLKRSPHLHNGEGRTRTPSWPSRTQEVVSSEPQSQVSSLQHLVGHSSPASPSQLG